MSIEQLIFLALVQGLTEFLPISSSGHLTLVHLLTDWADQGLMVDVAVHAGTLGAVLIYFRQDVWKMIVGGVMLLRGRMTPDGRLALYIVAATLPVTFFGYLLLKSGMVGSLRTAEIVAWSNLCFAVFLWLSDRMGMTVRRLDHLSWGSAFAIGFAQVLALIPGASRAGVTISAARFLGFERAEAARFSMLLSIPTILGAGVATSAEVYQAGNMALGLDMMAAALLSLVAALGAIHIFMKMMTHMTLTPFVIYRLVLGVLLLAWVSV